MNKKMSDLIAHYEMEECDFSDLEWVVEVSKRYCETLADCQVKCLLWVMAVELEDRLKAEREY